MNGLEWICENLDYRWDGLGSSYTTSSTPSAIYQDNNETLWGWNNRRCGLLYNLEAMRYLNDTILANSDWRVFTLNDLDSLVIATNSVYDCGLRLCENVDWSDSSWDGTNDLGFNLKPYGAYVNNRTEYKLTGALLHLNVQGTTKYMVSRRPSDFEMPNLITYSTYNAMWFLAIRLCRTLA